MAGRDRGPVLCLVWRIDLEPSGGPGKTEPSVAVRDECCSAVLRYSGRAAVEDRRDNAAARSAPRQPRPVQKGGRAGWPLVASGRPPARPIIRTGFASVELRCDEMDMTTGTAGPKSMMYPRTISQSHSSRPQTDPVVCKVHCLAKWVGWFYHCSGNICPSSH